MRRLSWTLIALLAAALALLVWPAVSSAAPSIAAARAQARELQDQVNSLNNKVEIVVEHYDAATQQLATVEARIATNQVQLNRARYELALAHQHLASQVVAIYKTPAAQYIDVALSARTFNDLVTRLTFYGKLGQQSAATVQQIDALKTAIEKRRAQLVVQRAQAQRLVAQISAQKSQIEASLARRQLLLRGARAEVRRLIVQMQREKAAAAARAAAAAQAAAREAAAAAQQSSSSGASGGGASGGSSPRGGYSGVADIAIAQHYLGVPYVWGGASPSGFDCSGLVMYVFAQLGVSLPHNAAMQFTCCTPVPRADLQPGDLVFYGYSAASIHHVGIYVGNNTMIDAPCTGEVVQYDTLFSDFYSGGRVN
jgi:cell wall-associated NlpC family hydrolase